eukprot:scaffold1554_cov332-Pavlova_lutheri.AAC.21
MRSVQKQAMKFTDQPAEDAQPTNNALPPALHGAGSTAPLGLENRNMLPHIKNQVANIVPTPARPTLHLKGRTLQSSDVTPAAAHAEPKDSKAKTMSYPRSTSEPNHEPKPNFKAHEYEGGDEDDYTNGDRKLEGRKVGVVVQRKKACERHKSQHPLKCAQDYAQCEVVLPNCLHLTGSFGRHWKGGSIFCHLLSELCKAKEQRSDQCKGKEEHHGHCRPRVGASPVTCPQPDGRIRGHSSSSTGGSEAEESHEGIVHDIDFGHGPVEPHAGEFPLFVFVGDSDHEPFHSTEGYVDHEHDDSHGEQVLEGFDVGVSRHAGHDGEGDQSEQPLQESHTKHDPGVFSFLQVVHVVSLPFLLLVLRFVRLVSRSFPLVSTYFVLFSHVCYHPTHGYVGRSFVRPRSFGSPGLCIGRRLHPSHLVRRLCFVHVRHVWIGTVVDSWVRRRSSSEDERGKEPGIPPSPDGDRPRSKPVQPDPLTRSLDPLVAGRERR